MGLTALRWAFSVRGLTGTEKAVLLGLAWHWNDETEQLNPATSLLAAELGISADSVQRAAKKLDEEYGLISVERTAHGGRSNHYRLRLDQPQPAAALPLPAAIDPVESSRTVPVEQPLPAAAPVIELPAPNLESSRTLRPLRRRAAAPCGPNRNTTNKEAEETAAAAAALPRQSLSKAEQVGPKKEKPARAPFGRRAAPARPERPQLSAADVAQVERFRVAWHAEGGEAMGLVRSPQIAAEMAEELQPYTDEELRAAVHVAFADPWYRDNGRLTPRYVCRNLEKALLNRTNAASEGSDVPFADEIMGGHR